MELSLDRDFSNDDFYLRPGSPCLGAGDPELVGPAWLAGDIGALGITDVSPIDADGDGYSPDLGEDCDDSDPSIHIDAEEVCDDGIDNNCDSSIDEGCETEDTAAPSDSEEDDTGEAEETDSDEPEGTGPDFDDRTESNSAETMASGPGLYVLNGKGCACSTTHSSPVRLWWALFPLILIRRRSQ